MKGLAVDEYEVHPRRQTHASKLLKCLTPIVLTTLLLLGWPQFSIGYDRSSPAYTEIIPKIITSKASSPYGSFPIPGDAFHFIPCTNTSTPPPLGGKDAHKKWASRFDPNPENWSWGNTSSHKHRGQPYDPFAGRGIYLCGYLDVPLDYTNSSDVRIARLGVVKYQVSGLALIGSRKSQKSHAGRKSKRTLVVEPGGPGGSGTSMAWRSAEVFSEKFTDGTFDVLGWDPRGVNTSLPDIACFPFDADRDRWSLLTQQYREVSGQARAQLQLMDAMNDATFKACSQRLGDLPRFMTTAFVARDLEEIRKALGEDELNGVLISYGTGIGQTYANMFPNSVGRLILDGTEYVRDHRELGGFGWTALDNGTDAWNDGFIGECIDAGPKHCALARPTGKDHPVTVSELKTRMQSLFEMLKARPVPGITKRSGPSLITYSAMVSLAYGSVYNAQSWPTVANMLAELEAGNSTLAAELIDKSEWEYDPTQPVPPLRRPSSDELSSVVICSDSYHAKQPEGLEWWEDLWQNMTAKSWIAGNSRFFNVFPCRQFNKHWPPPAEVYRGNLSHTLKHPILLIAETHDPATPLRNGRRLLHEMGENARLIVHHGYGHSSRDTSRCTNAIAKTYMMNGTLPKVSETHCYADEKPYRYGVAKNESHVGSASSRLSDIRDPLAIWQEHLAELNLLGRP